MRARTSGGHAARRRAHLRSEVGDRVRGSARRRSAIATASTGPASARDYDRIRDHIAAASCPGFDDFNARVRVARRVHAAERRPRQPHVRDRQRQGRADGQPRSSRSRCREGRLLLQTVRSHDQYNTTIYGLDDRYRGISQGRRVVFVQPDDLADARAGRRRRSSTSSASGATAPSGGRPAFRVVGLPRRRRHLRGLLPRGQRPRAARQHRRPQRHPHLEVGRRPPRAHLKDRPGAERQPGPSDSEYCRRAWGNRS